LVIKGGDLRIMGAVILLFGMEWMFWHVVLDFRRS